MQGFPLIPRAEMRLWQAGRGADLILKDEWRLNQRSLSFSLPPPGPVHPCTPTPLLCPAPTPISACEKPPAPPPSRVGETGGFLTLSVTALSVTALSQALSQALSANGSCYALGAS